MNSSELQQLLQSSMNTQTQSVGSELISDQINNALSPLMPYLQLAIVIGIVLTIIIVIYFLVNTIQKQRQHTAIMRIDKNLQRLVDSQLPPTEQPVHAKNSIEQHIEQK